MAFRSSTFLPPRRELERCAASPRFPPMRSISLLLACTMAAAATDEWPQFRGPTGDGHSDATGLPVAFGETDHVKWKTAIHGKAWSSQAIWKAQVWLTTATEDGTDWSVDCVDKES